MPERSKIVEREREFHNQRFTRDVDPRAHLDKWYQTIRLGAERQDRLVLGKALNADVLEYGCAGGELSLHHLNLAARARSLRGIDISDVAIAKANGFALQRHFSNARFQTMDAEQMTFGVASFDLIFGRGIIHHLDLDRCFAEIVRVLRPEGTAVFYEPMGHNPVFNIYRRTTPGLRTPDEHPLLVSDFTLARRYFSHVEVEYFGLFTLISALAPRFVRAAVYSAGVAIDRLLLRIPTLNRLAWYALITLRK